MLCVNEYFGRVARLQVLICGGDGTMGWILSCIDRLHPTEEDGEGKSAVEADEHIFPVAMMPLGTGKEEAREFKGKGASRLNLSSMI